MINIFRRRKKPTTPPAAANMFRDEMLALPYQEWKAVRREIIEVCGISRATFSNWIQRGVPNRKTDREAINAVLQRRGYKQIK